MYVPHVLRFLLLRVRAKDFGNQILNAWLFVDVSDVVGIFSMRTQPYVRRLHGRRDKCVGVLVELATVCFCVVRRLRPQAVERDGLRLMLR